MQEDFSKGVNKGHPEPVEGGVFMNKAAVIKFQIESLEQQLKVLKSKITPPIKKKALSDIYGIYEGKMDLSIEEIKKHEYALKGNL